MSKRSKRTEMTDTRGHAHLSCFYENTSRFTSANKPEKEMKKGK